MSLKQNLNRIIGGALGKVSPNLVERIRDSRDLKRGRKNGFDLDWKLCHNSDCRYASTGIQVGSKLFFVGGYSYGLGVLDTIEIFDMDKERWGEVIQLPSDAAETHHGIAVDGGYIYLLSGQKGPALFPSTRVCYSLNLSNSEWNRLPDLPEGRYAGAAQVFDGRLHFAGGGDEGRHYSTCNHWSIAVAYGKALEDSWKEEPPVPIPALHRGHLKYGDAWYLIGGQDEETPPVPGDPKYSYVPVYEVPQNHLLRYDIKTKTWSELTPLPIATSHIDTSCLIINDEFYIIGGQLGQDGLPVHQLPVSDEIYRYDPEKDRWTLVGHLPFRIKLMVCGYHKGKLFFATGQKDTSVEISYAKRFIGSAWCATFPGTQAPLKRGKSL